MIAEGRDESIRQRPREALHSVHVAQVAVHVVAGQHGQVRTRAAGVLGALLQDTFRRAPADVHVADLNDPEALLDRPGNLEVAQLDAGAGRARGAMRGRHPDDGEDSTFDEAASIQCHRNTVHTELRPGMAVVWQFGFTYGVGPSIALRSKSRTCVASFAVGRSSR